MFKRFGYFFLTNLVIVITLSVIVSVLGLWVPLTGDKIDYVRLMGFCLVYGMGGAFISLAMSRMMAKMMMGVQVIDPQNAGQFAPLVQTVHKLAKSANLPVMPEVGVYNSPEVNAFATGPTKSRALVAVSTGLLQNMDRNEIEGVLAHEVAHIQNGDMVTLTLIQGVVNAFVMFFARVASFFIAQFARDEARATLQFVVMIVLEILLGILGMMVVARFSRAREFRADRGSAMLSGRQNMIAALEALTRIHGRPAEAHASLDPFKISGRSRKGIAYLFSTHPPLEERIQALKTFA